MKNKMTNKSVSVDLTKERAKRVLARGEHSDHCHAVIGDIEFVGNDEFIVHDGKTAEIKHILESVYLRSGEQVWTGEHEAITLAPGKYKYVPQVEWDPYADAVRKARD